GYVSKTLGHTIGRVEGGGVRRVHFARLAEAAELLPCRVGCSGRCGSNRHRNYGGASSVVSQSRRTEKTLGWSPNGLTRKRAIEVRIEYMRTQHENGATEESLRVYQGFDETEESPILVGRVPMDDRTKEMLKIHQEAYLQGITADSG
ncbi:MAG: hypothetical protein IKZ87_08755, partial [Actinomycetaceae bacterium]|nr:hypothetical protein [Actinomycetaceae bacterium]